MKKTDGQINNFISYEYSDMNTNQVKFNKISVKSKQFQNKIEKEFKNWGSSLSRNNINHEVSRKYPSAESSPKSTTRVKIASTLGGYSKGVSLCVSRKSSINL